MAAEPVPVAVAFQRLFCYHGADEGQSEPYMWVVGFTIDGRTVTHAPDAARLTGSPAYWAPPGSHGSIGGPMGAGANRALPPAVCRFDTTLQPVVLSVAGLVVEVPGVVGLIGVVLEEDATSDDGAEAAHQALVQLVRTEIDEAVADLDLAGVAYEVGQAAAAGADPVAVARASFQARTDRVTERIQRYARATAVDAIVQQLSFPSAVVEGADPDGFMGVGVHVWSQQELDATTHSDRLEFTDVIAQQVPHLESSDYVYNLHGQAWQRVEVVWTPATDQLPPGRWRVTGVERRGRLGKQYVHALGGTFADGTPWLVRKGAVMDALAAGTHSFYVRGTSGVEADVVVQPDPVNPYFPSLTTRADRDPTNNLGALPACAVATRSLRPVDG